jgi:hypothetical protein
MLACACFGYNPCGDSLAGARPNQRNFDKGILLFESIDDSGMVGDRQQGVDHQGPFFARTLDEARRFRSLSTGSVIHQKDNKSNQKQSLTLQRRRIRFPHAKLNG